MDTFGDYVDNHLERHGYKYYVGTLGVQLANFAYMNIAIISESTFDLQAYQIYKFFALSLLLFAMAYFLKVAFYNTSPNDLFTFIILATICNCYMIFRDIMFILYPNFFVALLDNGKLV